MDFGLTEEQDILQDTIRRFLESECPTTRVRDIMETDDGFDRALWKQMAELVATVVVPFDHGGAGGELLDLTVAAQELGRAAAPGPFLGVSMSTIALLASENTEAQSNLLPGIAAGDLIVTMGIGESVGEWDSARLTTRADGDKLTGTKSLVPSAGVADAILIAAADADGPGLWMVDRGAAGLSIAPLSGNDMTRRLDRVTLDGTPAKRIASGRAAIDRAMDAGLVLLAADAYGGASKAHAMTVEYSLTREQFGQAIGNFQGVKHQLSNLITDLEPALSLCWYAAHAFDHIPDQASRHAALAKAHLCDLYDQVTRYAIELHGGIGFTWEFDLHLWWRRALFDRSFLGEPGYQRERAAALAGW